MTELENEKKAIVLDLYLTTDDNCVNSIAEKTGLPSRKVSEIINKYLRRNDK